MQSPYRKCDTFGLGYIKAEIVITGELDGRAKVTYDAQPDVTLDLCTLEKGMINDTIKVDHYYYKLWVKIMPIDCRKGHLKIRTKIM